VNPAWHLDCHRPQAGDSGPLQVLDREDGPNGRIVCVIPGHLLWHAFQGSVVRLLDKDDVENARLIEAAPQLRAVVTALLDWSAHMGGWTVPCWQDAQDLLARLRTPHAGV